MALIVHLNVFIRQIFFFVEFLIGLFFRVVKNLRLSKPFELFRLAPDLAGQFFITPRLN